MSINGYNHIGGASNPDPVELPNIGELTHPQAESAITAIASPALVGGDRMAARAEGVSGDENRPLRVKGGNPTDPDPSKRPTMAAGLSRSILHVLSSNEFVRVESVGPVALSVVMTAFRMACEFAEKRSGGIVLVMRQHEYDAEIGGKKAKGIRSRIFAIPIKDAV
jgi:hypothetical protein